MKKALLTILFLTTFALPVDRPIPQWFIYFRNGDWERKMVIIYPAVQPDEALKRFRKEHGDVFITCMAYNYFDECKERVWK